LHAAMDDNGTRIGLLAVAPTLAAGTLPAPGQAVFLASHLGADRIHTLGRWGTGSR